MTFHYANPPFRYWPPGGCADPVACAQAMLCGRCDAADRTEAARRGLFHGQPICVNPDDDPFGTTYYGDDIEAEANARAPYTQLDRLTDEEERELEVFLERGWDMAVVSGRVGYTRQPEGQPPDFHDGLFVYWSHEGCWVVSASGIDRRFPMDFLRPQSAIDFTERMALLIDWASLESWDDWVRIGTPEVRRKLDRHRSGSDPHEVIEDAIDRGRLIRVGNGGVIEPKRLAKAPTISLHKAVTK